MRNLNAKLKKTSEVYRRLKIMINRKCKFIYFIDKGYSIVYFYIQNESMYVFSMFSWNSFKYRVWIIVWYHTCKMINEVKKGIKI